MLDQHHLEYVTRINAAVTVFLEAVNNATVDFLNATKPDIWIADVLGATAVLQSAMRTLEFTTGHAHDKLAEYLEGREQ